MCYAKYLLGLMKRADSPEEYERYIRENKEYFAHIPKSAVDVLDTYLNLKVMMKVLEYKDADNGEEEEADMCIALDTIERNAIERGLAKGMAQGIEQGIEVFILDHQEEGTAKERVQEKLIRRFGLSSEKAEGYLLKYNYV